MKILKSRPTRARCECGTRFEFGAINAFVRYVVCGMINSGTFDREPRVYVRCPSCRKRVDVTGSVALEAVMGNEDPLCKCPGDYCRCS